MFIAVLVGCIIIGGKDWFWTFIDQVYVTGCNEDTVWIVSLMCVVGVLVALFGATGGSHVLVKIVEKKVKGERNLFLWTWLLSALLALIMHLQLQTLLSLRALRFQKQAQTFAQCLAQASQRQQNSLHQRLLRHPHSLQTK